MKRQKVLDAERAMGGKPSALSYWQRYYVQRIPHVNSVQLSLPLRLKIVQLSLAHIN